MSSARVTELCRKIAWVTFAGTPHDCRFVAGPRRYACQLSTQRTGFSLCSIGAVLDADTTSFSPQAMGIQFLDLTTGHLFPTGGPYTFNYGTASGTASYVPRIFRSPDGTILIVLTASTIGPSQLTAVVFDQINPGSPDVSCQPANVSSSFSASITANNQISATLAGTSCTITIY